MYALAERAGMEVLAERFHAGAEVPLAEVFDVAGLTPREQHVIRERLAGRSYGGIVADLAMIKTDGRRFTRQRVEQIEAVALGKLGLGESLAASVHASEQAARAMEKIEQGRCVRAAELHSDPATRTQRQAEPWEVEHEAAVQAFLEERSLKLPRGNVAACPCQSRVFKAGRGTNEGKTMLPCIADDRPALRLIGELPLTGGNLININPPALVREAQPLAALLAQAKALYGEIVQAERFNLQRACDLGGLLNEIKAGCKHGEWLPRLAKMDIRHRRAAVYMRIAKMPAAALSGCESIRAAMELIADMPDEGEAACAESTDRCTHEAGKTCRPASAPACTSRCKHRRANGRRHKVCQACDAEAALLAVCNDVAEYLDLLVSQRTVTGPAINLRREALKAAMQTARPA